MSPPTPKGPTSTGITDTHEPTGGSRGRSPPGAPRWRPERPGLNNIPPGQGREGALARADDSLAPRLMELTFGEWLKTRKKSRSCCGSALSGGRARTSLKSVESGPGDLDGDRRIGPITAIT